MQLLHPKLVVSIAAVVLLGLLVSVVQEMSQRLQVQREVQRLEQQVQDMQRSVLELESLNQYIRTDAYQERLARELLNYSAPGEKVVLIPEDTVSTPEAPSDQAEQPRSSIPLQWWRLFFVDEHPLLTQ